MAGLLAGWSTRVPIPAPPDYPDGYSASVLTWVLMVAAMLAAFVFTVEVFRAVGRENRGETNNKPVYVLAVVLMVAGALFLISQRFDKWTAERAEDAFQAQQYAGAQARLVQIGDFYGVTLEMDPDDLPFTWVTSDEVTVIWPDGATEVCWISAPERVYEVRCGGEDFESSTELEPAG